MTQAEETGVPGRASKIDREAFVWVARQELGLTPKEQRKLDAWLARSPEHPRAFLHARAWTEHLERIAALHRASPEQIVVSPPTLNRRALLVTGVSAVATAGLAVLLAKEWLAPQVRMERHETRMGQVSKVALLDTSELLLNTATRVLVGYGPARREARFVRGEALFTVRSDPRPFIVHVGDWVLRTAGAAFDVRQNVQSFAVAVSEGSLEVLHAVARRAGQLQLAANQEATLGSGEAAQVHPVSGTEIERRLAWRTGMIIFNGQSARDAVAEMNRYSTRKIVLPDLPISRQPLLGSFRISDSDAFVSMLQVTLGLQAVASESEIVLQPGRDTS